MQVNKMRRSNPTSSVVAASCGGFTLIELLVSVVIIGVLATIALPSYLNQAAKARGSEAKSSLGSINRSQQAYRWEYGTFADNIIKLDIKINGKFYTYSIPYGSATDTVARANTQDDGLRVLSAAVTLQSGTFTQVICESQETQLLNTAATIPSGGGGTPLGCPSGYQIIN